MSEDLEKELKEEDIPEEAEEKAEGEAGTEEASEAEKAEETEAGSEEKEAEQSPESTEEKAPEAAEEEKPKEGGKRFWQKKPKKDKKDEKIEELNDRLMRNMAEFENFRKRTEKEKSANYAIGAKNVIEKILPVVDNFERGLAAADKEDAFTQGMEKTYKQLQSVLTDLGVKEIEAEGKEFDPNLHYAVMHGEDENLGENVVAEVLQKGYTYKDMVVRYAMVKVVN